MCLYILLGKVKMLMELADALLSKMLECMELMGEGMDSGYPIGCYDY